MGTGDGGALVAAGHGLRRDTGYGAARHEQRQSVRLDALDGVAVELLHVDVLIVDSLLQSREGLIPFGSGRERVEKYRSICCGWFERCGLRDRAQERGADSGSCGLWA